VRTDLKSSSNVYELETCPCNDKNFSGAEQIALHEALIIQTAQTIFDET